SPEAITSRVTGRFPSHADLTGTALVPDVIPRAEYHRYRPLPSHNECATEVAVCERIEQIRWGLAQLKKVDSLKLSNLGFSRVLMIVLFHIGPLLPPGDVTSKTDFMDYLGPKNS
ncbi:hypothetical protein PRIPAC_83034, partial [Pristionchus pacificus]|uniref:Uncharacterized protein n=1 Tax=Pristionchus pacificus TaxID=54126 RepID=A0A2A6CNQ1_PRIPA